MGSYSTYYYRICFFYFVHCFSMPINLFTSLFPNFEEHSAVQIYMTKFDSLLLDCFQFFSIISNVLLYIIEIFNFLVMLNIRLIIFIVILSSKKCQLLFVGEEQAKRTNDEGGAGSKLEAGEPKLQKGPGHPPLSRTRNSILRRKKKIFTNLMNEPSHFKNPSFSSLFHSF